jgi:uncharacterized hydantoinase/oxoprolinase family protein
VRSVAVMTAVVSVPTAQTAPQRIKPQMHNLQRVTTIASHNRRATRIVSHARIESVVTVAATSTIADVVVVSGKSARARSTSKTRAIINPPTNNSRCEPYGKYYFRS